MDAEKRNELLAEQHAIQKRLEASTDIGERRLLQRRREEISQELGTAAPSTGPPLEEIEESDQKLYHTAATLYRQHQYEKAIQILGTLLDRHPGNQRLIDSLRRCQVAAQQDPSAAIQAAVPFEGKATTLNVKREVESSENDVSIPRESGPEAVMGNSPDGPSQTEIPGDVTLNFSYQGFSSPIMRLLSKGSAFEYLFDGEFLARGDGASLPNQTIRTTIGPHRLSVIRPDTAGAGFSFDFEIAMRGSHLGQMTIRNNRFVLDILNPQGQGVTVAAKDLPKTEQAAPSARFLFAGSFGLFALSIGIPRVLVSGGVVEPIVGWTLMFGGIGLSIGLLVASRSSRAN